MRSSIFNLCLAAVCLSLIIVAGMRRDELSARRPNKAEPLATSDEYEPAMARASKERTQILLVFGAKWCVWCQKFTRDVMPNQRIASRLESKRISVVKIDVDKRRDLSSKYGVKTLPTLILVDGDDMELKRTTGFVSVREFLGWID